MYIWNTKNQEKLSCYFFWCRLHIAADDNGDLNHWKKKSLSWYILVLLKYCYNNAEFNIFNRLFAVWNVNENHEDFKVN